MTLDEFKPLYQPLANKFPSQYAKVELREAMYQEMKGFQPEWVQALVHKIVMTNNPNYNIKAEIDQEKRRRGFDRVNNDNREEYERIRKNATGHGYEAELRKFEANSLWEAVEKSKKGTG